MELKNIVKISLKNFNEWTILSLLFLIGGLIFWITWGLRYNVWTDIGIYSITIVFVISGILGLIISLMDRTEEVD